jgi:hypothetical protein
MWSMGSASDRKISPPHEHKRNAQTTHLGQGRRNFDYSEAMCINLNYLGPARGLQVRERRVKDLSLTREGRQPLQLSTTLQLVLGHDPEDERLVAYAVGYCCLDVCCGGHRGKLRLCMCVYVYMYIYVRIYIYIYIYNRPDTVGCYSLSV